MNELVIKTHDFEVAKKGLKEFSEQATTDFDLKKVDASKDVGEWFGEWLKGGGIGTDHKVTGTELNGLTNQIQKHFIDINTMHGRFIQEFGQVYNALEALDKDYIQAILISIKATEETSRRIEATQEQIEKIVNDQKKTLEVLKKFKQKIDDYAHIGDIDKIWSDCQKWHKEIASLSNSIKNTTSTSKENAKKIDGLKAALKTIDDKMTYWEKNLNQQIAQLESILALTCALEQIVHLQDIDEMWESLSDVHNSLMNIGDDLNSIRDDVTKQQTNIEILFHFKETLSGYKHLQDIDEIWSKTEVHSDKLNSLAQQSDNMLELVRVNQSHIDELSKHKQKLCGIVHLNDVDELWDLNKMYSNQLSELEKQSIETNNLIQSNKELIDVSMGESVEKTDTAVQMLAKKIKYAYLLAGGSLGLALIELIVILFKVM